MQSANLIFILILSINPEFKEMMRSGIPVSGEVKYDYKIINQAYVKSRHRNVHYFGSVEI